MLFLIVSFGFKLLAQDPQLGSARWLRNRQALGNFERPANVLLHLLHRLGWTAANASSALRIRLKYTQVCDYRQWTLSAHSAFLTPEVPSRKSSRSTEIYFFREAPFW